MISPVLISDEDVCCVVLNGSCFGIGFLKTSPKDNPQGNYGVLDVIAAIHWLRLNAGAFGGDSGRLTLIGIGQGAAIVHLLMLSPMARGNQRTVQICPSHLIGF